MSYDGLRMTDITLPGLPESAAEGPEAGERENVAEA